MGEQEQKPTAHFDEYQMFFESAERVTDRRINLNRTNYTICVAIITGVAFVGSWGLNQTEPQLRMFVFAVIAFVSAASVILCMGWLRQITDLKTLNNAKFEVLNRMASELQLIKYSGEPVPSFQPFEKEWDIITRSKGTTKILGFHALKGSTVEYVLPRSFMFLFFLIMVFSAYQALAHFDIPLESFVTLIKTIRTAVSS